MTERKTAQATLREVCKEDFLPIVLQLMTDLAAGRKAIVPCSNQTTDKALRFLISHIQKSTVNDCTEDSIRALLREVLGVDTLPAITIVTEGVHRLKSGFVIAAGTARVEISGTGLLIAFGDAMIIARERVSIHGSGSARLNLYDYVLAQLDGDVQVNSYQYVTGRASGNVSGTARGKSRWIVSEDAIFDTYDNATVDGDGNVRLRSYGSSRVRGRGGKVVAQLFEGANGWFGAGSTIELNGHCIAYAHSDTHTTSKSGSARVMPLSQSEDFVWS
ncbi:MAG: hypothetical protein K8F91_07650 [Candidatus Obscuribacterales bacterium]|nr:hypothetical protein [Candidatus Obscuribacterales bacterium]